MYHPSRIMGKSYSKLLQAELQRKHDLVDSFLGEHGLDGVWLAHHSNFAWYTGGTDNYIVPPLPSTETSHINYPRSLSLIVMRDCTYILADARVSSASLPNLTSTLGWKLCRYDWQDPGAERKLLVKLAANRCMGTDTPQASFKLLDKELARLSLTLMAGEQARYRILSQECTAAVETVVQTVIREQTEQQIVDQLTDYCQLTEITPLRVRMERERFPRACYRSIWASNRASTRALLQLVAARGGLHTAVTRMVVLGGLSQEIRDAYRAIIELATAYCHVARPGQTMRDVYAQSMAYCNASPLLRCWQPQLRAHITGYQRPGRTSAEPMDNMLNVNQTISCTVSAGKIKAGGTFMILPDWNEWLTVTDNWPMTTVALEGHTYYVPDILRL